MTRVLVYAQHEFSLWTIPESCVVDLRREFPQVEVVHARDMDEFARELPRAEVLFGWGLDARNFPLAQGLRWVQITAAGAQSMLFPAMAASDVELTNARGLHAVPIAEHVMGVMLSFARKLHLARDAQNQGRWQQEALWNDPPAFRELAGETLGLLGLGGIGLAVATRARAFGMRVLGLRRRALPAPEVDEIVPRQRLHDLLGRSHVVVASLPSTAKTTAFLGAAEFSAMRADALLVNVGRGRVIDEMALIRGLEQGRPAGAALDVFAEEPLPPESPLYRMPNVLVTPHVAGVTPHYWPRLMDIFRDNLRRYLKGEALLNRVDKHAGY